VAFKIQTKLQSTDHRQCLVFLASQRSETRPLLPRLFYDDDDDDDDDDDVQ